MARRALSITIAAASLLALLAVPATASAATGDYQYWIGPAQAKYYQSCAPPSTRATASVPSSTTIWVKAAQGEYEGRQLVLHPYAGGVTDMWLEPSDLVATDASGNEMRLDKSNVSVYGIGYVVVRYPSYGYKRRGLEPDPLIPMTLANGERLGWVPDGSNPASWTPRSVADHIAQPYYVLFRVPDGTPAGSYRGTLTITGKDATGTDLPEVALPVCVVVRSFSIEARTLPTSFGIKWSWVDKTSTPGGAPLPAGSRGGLGSTTVTETTSFRADQRRGWYQYLYDHRVDPDNLVTAWETIGSTWRPGETGVMRTRKGATGEHEYLDDFLTTGDAATFDGERFGFTTAFMPEISPRDFVGNPFTSGSSVASAASYYRTMTDEMGEHVGKSYVKVVDEPRARELGFVHKYYHFVRSLTTTTTVTAEGTRTVRALFMVSASAPEFRYRIPHYIDVFVQRLHFYYRDYRSWVSPIRYRAHRKVWIYSHATRYQNQAPMYLVDKPLTESRAMGWFAWHTRAAGLLHYSLNRWGLASSGNTYRDPYMDPLSFRVYWNRRYVYSNGDGSLVYPGYYPRYGLYVQGAPPVGSLRMEALRDGLEDYEYIKLVRNKGGFTLADSFNRRVIGRPRTMYVGGRPTFPGYAKTSWPYEKARDDMGNWLELHP